MSTAPNYQYMQYQLQINGDISYYELVGVQQNDTLKIINKRMFQIQWMIDVSGGTSHTKYRQQWTDFHKIKETLLDSKQREQYNQHLPYSKKGTKKHWIVK